MIVFAIGIANALGAPGLSAILPTLVPREDLTGAVALTSVQMNLSRVIGPAIGALIYAWLDAGPVFAINAVTYVFAVIGLVWARYPRYAARAQRAELEHRLLSGLRIARADPVIRYVLLTLVLVLLLLASPSSASCRSIAEVQPSTCPSAMYGLLYATFGLGAALGRVQRRFGARRIVRRSRCCGPASSRSRSRSRRSGWCATSRAAFVIVAILGYMYFLVVTCLSTILQKHLRDEERGRVMALWIMVFGGTVPLGVLVAGPFAKAYSTEVLLVGAVWALVLALVLECAVAPGERRTDD